MKAPSFVPVAVFLLMGAFAPSSARAQESPAVSLHAFSGQALLGHGDHVGTYQGGTLMRQFHPLGYAGFTAGVVNSSDLQFRPDDLRSWRHRQFYLFEGLVHFDVVTIRFSEWIANHFSFRMGVSYQYGHEETPLQATGPGIATDGPAIPPGLLAGASLYHYSLDGQEYSVRSTERSSAAFGSLMALEYSVEVGPVLVAVHGGYRHYRRGTPLLTYGLGVGLRY
jgi:hypothetical protein